MYFNLRVKTMLRFFSKRVLIFAGLHQPPHPLTLTAYPIPREGGTPTFFIKMTGKNAK